MFLVFWCDTVVRIEEDIGEGEGKGEGECEGGRLGNGWVERMGLRGF